MPAIPDGKHTPLTNAPVEAVHAVETTLEEPFTGENDDAQDVTADGQEGIVRPPKNEAASGETWNLPDISKVPDIGIASFGNRPLRETVHGADDRVQVEDTSKYPFRATASLLITARDGSSWVGTGWFIGPRTLATAGHVVCIKNSGIPEREGWVRNIQVIPGRNGGSAPYGAATSGMFWSVKGWVEDGDENYDYAAIVLPSELGRRTGWFGFGVFDDAALTAATGNIGGYPADKPSGTFWWDAHQIGQVSDTKLFYDIDSFGGQSGASVYAIRDGKRIGIGVHAYGGPVTNSATRISLPVFQNLRNWKAL